MDPEGKLVESNDRAETFARHLEKVQWAVRHLSDVVPNDKLGSTLQTCSGEIQAEELRAAVKQLKSGKAAVQVPAEYLKAVLDTDLSCGGWLLTLMRLCWSTKTTPKSWHIAEVIPVYKKGNPADCNNYRPISLVSVLYKVYATILLNRLKAAGAETRLWSKQFGFKRSCSVEDALFIVRRKVEQALASREGGCLLLALDWKKAFDCLAPEWMMQALERFGLSSSMTEAISAIYKDRAFTVRDGGNEAKPREQHAGISQGSLLSPFLFGMAMTILMTDAKNMLGIVAKQEYTSSDLDNVLFADDTLLMSTRATNIEEYMACVTACGFHYGLEVHWGKVHWCRCAHKK